MASSSLDDAICLAVRAHAGQVDKGGKPYIFHCLRVMLAVAGMGEEYAIAGILHDIIEDTEYPLTKLGPRFGATIRDAVDALTRRKDEGERYATYVRRASANPIAKVVKLADLRDNLSRIDQLPPHKRGIRVRYERALEKLGS